MLATSHQTTYYPYNATDPANSLTGSPTGNSWFSASGNVTEQRFHIKLASAIKIERILYANNHGSGANTDRGVQNFTFWGSNNNQASSNVTFTNAGDYINLNNHGLVDDVAVIFSGAGVPSGLVAGTTYFVKNTSPADANKFHVSASRGGGTKTFSADGSGTMKPDTFQTLVYSVDTDWTQITTASTKFLQHTAVDEADLHTIDVTNSTSYQYYAIKCADNYGDGTYMGFRRVVMESKT